MRQGSENPLKKVDLKEEITKHYKWALENPTILTVSALQEEWIRWVEDEILPKWNTNLDALKTDRMALAKLKMKVVKRRDNLWNYTLGEKAELNWVLREISELESKA